MKPTTSMVNPTTETAAAGPQKAVSGLSTLAILVAMLGLVAVLISPRPHVGSAEQPSPAPQVLGATSQRVAPGQNIQTAIDVAGPGATIVIGAGVHTGQSIVPLDNMVITGEAGAVLDGAGASLPYAIWGDAANVTVSRLEIRNYTKPIWGPNNYRHQGAIHGAKINSGGGFVSIASNWRIENNDIHHNAGWGVSPGDGFTVANNALHHNGMAGIGGGDFNGGLFEKNDIYANNDASNSYGDFNYETGQPWAWAWNAAGIKVANVNCRSLTSTGACSSGTPLTIRANNVHDNRGVGIWCDINCNDVVIENNLVERNIGVDSVGIFYEISQNGIIRDNIVRDQGANGDYLSPSGILVWSSDGVIVERNQVEGTKNAIVGNARPREFNRTLRNLVVRDNVIITRGQATRVGIATDEASDFKTAGNRFSNNYYDNQSKMTFWWTDRSRGDSSLTLQQWMALGFQPATAPPARPTTPSVIAPAPVTAVPVPTPVVPAAPTPTPTPPAATRPAAVPTPAPVPKVATPGRSTPAANPAQPVATSTPASNGSVPAAAGQDQSARPRGEPSSSDGSLDTPTTSNTPATPGNVDDLALPDASGQETVDAAAPEALAFDPDPVEVGESPADPGGDHLALGIGQNEGATDEALPSPGLPSALALTMASAVAAVAVWLSMRSVQAHVSQRSGPTI